MAHSSTIWLLARLGVFAHDSVLVVSFVHIGGWYEEFRRVDRSGTRGVVNLGDGLRRVSGYSHWL
jgi:hypothetical protein